MRLKAPIAVLVVLGVLAGAGIALSSNSGTSPAAGDPHLTQDWYWTPAPSAPGDGLSAAVPTPTWEKYCHLGPPPDPWESWEALFEHARQVIERYGPPPTPDPAMFPTPIFEGPPPPGYPSWEAFVEDTEKLFEEVQATGAEARAACTGEQVCVETSFGPVCVAPPGEGVQFCLGDGCPTPELWRP